MFISGALTLVTEAAYGGVAVSPFALEISIAGDGPHAAVMPLVGLAVVGAGFAAGVVLATVRLEPAPAAGFSLTLAATVLVFVVVAYTAWEVGFAIPDSDRTPFEGGWIKYGGRNAVAHATMLLAAASPILRGIILRVAASHTSPAGSVERR